MTYQQSQLDAERQQQKLYLSLYQPDIVFYGAITGGDYNSSTQTIAIDSTISGSLSDINSNLYQIAFIGSGFYNDDYGRTYVRNVTGTSVQFVESDHINWDAATHITILNFTEVTPIFPRIIQDPGDELSVIFYKAYDIAYTDQNINLGSWVDPGNHYAGFLDPASGQHQVYYTSSGTSSLNNEALTYLWAFEGALITGSTSADPGYVTYDTPGHYSTILAVTTAAGAVDYSVRYVSIYDHPQSNGTNKPYTNWEFTSASGNRDSSGYRFGIRLRGSTFIRDGWLAVIFSDDYYSNYQMPQLLKDLTRQSIKFIGSVSNGSIRRDFRDNSVEFDLVSPTGVMENAETFSVSVEDSPAPTTWYELQYMTVERALYHYYRWHSTLLINAAVRYTAKDRAIQYFDSDRDSLLAGGKTLVDGALLGNIVSDKQGRVWIEQEYHSLDSPLTLEGNIAVDKSQWMNEPIIDLRLDNEVSFIEMGGIAYSGATGTFNAYLCGAPGNAPAYRGSVSRIQGLALLSQGDLNTIAGNYYAAVNSPYANSTYRLKRYTDIDIAPLQSVSMSMESTENVMGLSFTNKPFSIRGLSFEYDGRLGLLVPTMELNDLVTGYAASTIIIPDIPPTDDGGFSQPSPQVPPVPGVIPSITPGGGVTPSALFLRIDDFTTPSTSGEISFVSVASLPSIRDLTAYWNTSSPDVITLPAPGTYYGTAYVNFNRQANTLPADTYVTISIYQYSSTDGTGTQSVYNLGTVFLPRVTGAVAVFNVVVPFMISTGSFRSIKLHYTFPYSPTTYSMQWTVGGIMLYRLWASESVYEDID